MRFAITATDRYLGVWQALIERAWIPIKVFTTPVDGRVHQNRAVIDYARRLNVDVQISRLSQHNLQQLTDQGCDVLVVASYNWRIGDWRPYLRYAVNFHPSPLPRGRGPYPLPAAILEQCRLWGVACHKLEHEFDAGDVLKMNEVALCEQDDHDSLDLKLQLTSRQLAGQVGEHFEAYWRDATPQIDASYYKNWTLADRSLDFSQPVEQILRRVRAFGPLECLAMINHTRFFVRRAVGWQQAHALPIGSVVHENNLSMLIAAADGFVGLTEWSLVEPGAIVGSCRRSSGA